METLEKNRLIFNLKFLPICKIGGKSEWSIII